MQSALWQEWGAEFEEKGKIEGRREGKREGKIEGKLEVATEMLRDGDSHEKISRITKLPIEKIKALSV